MIKIEYSKLDKSYDIKKLLQVLKNFGFEYIMFKHDPYSYKSNPELVNILGKKSI